MANISKPSGSSATKTKGNPVPHIDSIKKVKGSSLKGLAEGQFKVEISGSNLLGQRGLQDTRVVLVEQNTWKNPLLGSKENLLLAPMGPGEGTVQVAVYTYYLVDNEPGQTVEEQSNIVEFTFPSKEKE